MNLYYYDGPIMLFEKCVERHWKGQTNAVSEKKARCNLAYQWKKENDYKVNTKITLPGKIILAGTTDQT